MLIKSLQAINFRKYKELTIDDIPEQGVISLSGANESGKTSVGEAICFVLFGRTFVLDESHVTKVIRWGKDHAKVELQFLDNNDRLYRLSRSIDQDGETTVELMSLDSGRQDSQQPDETPLHLTARKDVDEALGVIIGFDYAAFANSFYLVQRELTAPDPNSSTIKQMAGIGDYAQINDELSVERARNVARHAELEPQCTKLQTQLDEINLDETWLPDLIDADETLDYEKKTKSRLLDGLNQHLQLYTDNLPLYRSASRLSRFWYFLSWLLLPVLLLLLILWAIIRYLPDQFASLSHSISEQVTTRLVGWSDFALPAIILMGALLLIVAQLLRRASKNRMRKLNEQASLLSQDLDHAYRHVTTEVETLLPERVVQMIHERNEINPLLVLPPREQFSNIGHLAETTDQYGAFVDDLAAAVDRIDDVLRKQETEINKHIVSLKQDISAEKERSDQAGELRAELIKLNRHLKACEHTIQVHDCAREMLQRAAEDSIENFNVNIARTSEKALPHFTEGNYQKIKINDDFSVRCFSDEKHGYMDFDEISSGTQRQIMLALRMAMSEELAINTGNERQFIFLDEPFAFFDQWRTRSTLQSLPEVSKVITQVWVVSQEFPPDSGIDKMIECPIDSDTLNS